MTDFDSEAAPYIGALKMNHETATAAGRRSALNAKSDDAAQVILEAVACAMIDNGASEDTALLYCTFFERGLAA